MSFVTYLRPPELNNRAMERRSFPRLSYTRTIAGLYLLLVGNIGLAEPAPTSVPGDYAAQMLLQTSTDVLGKSLSYPDCEPAILSEIIRLAPGETGKPHQHLTPLYGYILTGTVSVDYAGGITKHYGAGQALMEAMDVTHHGYNAGTEPASLLAVYFNCRQ